MTMADVELRVDGGLSVVAAGATRPIGGPKAEQLLAVLVAHPGRPVSSDRLVDALWPQTPPKSAVATIQTLVSRLRSLLDPGFRIDLDTAGYQLVTVDGNLDVVVFERLVAASATMQPTSGSRFSGWH